MRAGGGPARLGLAVGGERGRARPGRPRAGLHCRSDRRDAGLHCRARGLGHRPGGGRAGPGGRGRDASAGPRRDLRRGAGAGGGGPGRGDRGWGEHRRGRVGGAAFGKERPGRHERKNGRDNPGHAPGARRTAERRPPRRVDGGHRVHRPGQGAACRPALRPAPDGLHAIHRSFEPGPVNQIETGFPFTQYAASSLRRGRYP